MVTRPVADRISLILDGLCRAVAARIAGGALAAALIVLICRRVRRIERLVLGLLLRFQAGRLRVRAGGVSGGRREENDRGARIGVAGNVLPRGFAWLVPLVPQWAAGYGSQLRVVLAEPEMIALLAASPQAGRLLRPLCRMLGIEAEVLRPRAAVQPVAACGDVAVFASGAEHAFAEDRPAAPASGAEMRRQAPCLAGARDPPFG